MAKISPSRSRQRLRAGCWVANLIVADRADARCSSWSQESSSNAGAQFLLRSTPCHPLWYMRCGLPSLP
ncbi:hypothetical protein ACLB1Q_12195 [Escherichia coli]